MQDAFGPPIVTGGRGGLHEEIYLHPYIQGNQNLYAIYLKTICDLLIFLRFSRAEFTQINLL